MEKIELVFDAEMIYALNAASRAMNLSPAEIMTYVTEHYLRHQMETSVAYPLEMQLMPIPGETPAARATRIFRLYGGWRKAIAGEAGFQLMPAAVAAPIQADGTAKFPEPTSWKVLFENRLL